MRLRLLDGRLWTVYNRNDVTVNRVTTKDSTDLCPLVKRCYSFTPTPTGSASRRRQTLKANFRDGSVVILAL